MSIRLNYSVVSSRASFGGQAACHVDRVMMKVVMSENVLVNEHPESVIGSMHGTMEIIGDIISPIDVKWDAEMREGPDECLRCECVKDS
jgi:hypothetical protein